jgi:predicted component of type VI protein secretion system
MKRERRFTIGRGSNCDIVLADSTISRLHATLTLLENGKLLLTDCQSANGTRVYIKKKPTNVSHELVSPHDTVQFGDMVWEVADLLRALWLKHPTFDPTTFSNQPPNRELQNRPTVTKERLVVCTNCHKLKPKDAPCPHCNE